MIKYSLSSWNHKLNENQLMQPEAQEVAKNGIRLTWFTDRNNIEHN